MSASVDMGCPFRTLNKFPSPLFPDLGGCQHRVSCDRLLLSDIQARMELYVFFL